MPVELKVPSVGESVTEVQIGQWRKQEGDRVEQDESVVEIESDKATVDLLAPVAGTMAKMLKQAGEKALVGEVIGYLNGQGEVDAGGSEKQSQPAAQTTASSGPETQVAVEKKRGQTAIGSVQPTLAPTTAQSTGHVMPSTDRVMPSADRVMSQHGVKPGEVGGTGPGGRVLKEDVERHVERSARDTEQGGRPGTPVSAISASKPNASPGTAKPAQSSPPAVRKTAEKTELTLPALRTGQYSREEEHVVMSPIRRRIAERLVEAQHNAALLTTFNEIDMTEVMALRGKFKDSYQERYGVKLGFMSFFVKAAVDALKQVPQVNAEIREPHVIYRNYYDIGIAVGGGKGLVVPILRNAEFMSFAEIEKTIGDFGRRAGENKIKLEELQGGTFTISNGGVYGSLLSTPIVNPPQSGILGLHAIQDRPVARNGQVVIRPMMYVALTYDHRVVDGREAVTFLKRIKEGIEDPTRLLIEV